MNDIVYLSGDVNPLKLSADDRRFAVVPLSSVPASLDGLMRAPLHIQGLDCRVINIVPSTNEEYDFFVAGRFECLSDANRHRFDSHDLLEAQGGDGAIRIFHVVTQRIQCPLGNWRQLCIVVSDAPDTAGGKDMLSILNGVIKNRLEVVNDIPDKVALDHVFFPAGVVFVCEGAETAKSLAQHPILTPGAQL